MRNTNTNIKDFRNRCERFPSSPTPPTKKYKKIDLKKGKNKWLMMTDGCLFSLVVLQWPGQRHRCASSGLCEQVTAEETAPTTTNTYVMLL